MLYPLNIEHSQPDLRPLTAASVLSPLLITDPQLEMAEQSSPAPDLASILRALQESSQRQKAENQAQAQLGAQQPCQPPQQRSTTPPCPPPEHLQQPPHVRASHIAPPLHQPKIVDPATIIEWAAGLRCVVRTITGREEIMQEIRKVAFVFLQHKRGKSLEFQAFEHNDFERSIKLLNSPYP